MSEITVTKRDREAAAEAIGDVFGASPHVIADWVASGEGMPSDDRDGSGEWVHEDNAELWYSVAATIAKARAEGVQEERARCVAFVEDARDTVFRGSFSSFSSDTYGVNDVLGILDEMAYAMGEPEAAREGGET